MLFVTRPTFRQGSCWRLGVCLLITVGLCPPLEPQTTPTQSPGQTPATAPQVQQSLSSYEGQQVSFVELAGRPDVDTKSLLPLLAQKAGEPFSQAKVDASIAALQRTGKFDKVQLDVRPEARGVRVLFVLQPALYFGIFEFPGAERLSYARLL
ncbi:MAG TPA: POTRA domain-containing protein, partial [Bryobacteraceae bacterium]|nr:POTRA domain-containing protein [Bryobacteraceae bacterium]